MNGPVSPRRRRIRRAALIVVAGAAALPAAAFALPSISGGDGVAINPSLQSPDFIVSSADPSLFWQVKNGSNTVVDFGFGGSVDVSASPPDGGYTLEATDADGTVPRSFIVDATPPGAPAVITPAEGAEYTVGQSVALSYFCSAGATCSPANGSAVDTSSPGGKTLTVTATDAAGNQTSVDVHYSVSSPPVDSAPPTGGSLSVPAATGSATITVTAGAASDPSGPITYALAQGNTPPGAGEYGAPGVLPTSFTLAGPTAPRWCACGRATRRATPARSRPTPSCSTAAGRGSRSPRRPTGPPTRWAPPGSPTSRAPTACRAWRVARARSPTAPRSTRARRASRASP